MKNRIELRPMQIEDYDEIPACEMRQAADLTGLLTG